MLWSHIYTPRLQVNAGPIKQRKILPAYYQQFIESISGVPAKFSALHEKLWIVHHGDQEWAGVSEGKVHVIIMSG